MNRKLMTCIAISLFVFANLSVAQTGADMQVDDDKKFRDLCCDYADAVELHRYWCKQGNSRALERAQDYTTIVAEFEKEIFREITARDHLTTER